MEEMKKKSVKKDISIPQNGNSYNVHGDEVLELDELFGVQGGINTEENHEHIEETCGLGCYNMNIVIKKDYEKQ